MRTLIAASLAAAALAASGSARAADLDARVPYKAPTAAPIQGWSGFYAGVHLGYGRGGAGTTSFFGTDAAGAAAGLLTGGFGGSAAAPVSPGGGGVLGGGQIGYNWTIDRRWVLGLETDISGSGIGGDAHTVFSLTALPGTDADLAIHRSLDWFGTVRGRLGALATDSLLLYGTGGFAYGRLSEDVTLTSAATLGITNPAGDFHCTAAQACFAGSSARVATGWAAGAGAEYALSPNLNLRAEYLHVSLGGGSTAVTAVAPSPASLPAQFTASSDRSGFDIGRVGLNYRF